MFSSLFSRTRQWTNNWITVWDAMTLIWYHCSDIAISWTISDFVLDNWHKSKLIWNQHSNIFVQENAFWNVFCGKCRPSLFPSVYSFAQHIRHMLYRQSIIHTFLQLVYHGLSPTMESNYIHYKAWDNIPLSFPNFNGAAVRVWSRIS